MGIKQQHPDAGPPTAPQATGGSDLPRLMEQLTRALLHVPAEPSDPAGQAERAGLSAPSAPPAESPAEVEAVEEQPEAVVPVDAPAPVTPPAPRRPGAVLGELAFLDE